MGGGFRRASVRGRLRAGACVLTPSHEDEGAEQAWTKRRHRLVRTGESYGEDSSGHAGRGGIRIRRRPAGRYDARADGRRRHSLRPNPRRSGLSSLAGDQGQSQPVLGGTEQGKALARGRHGDPARPGDRDQADLRSGAGGRHVPDQSARPRLDGLREPEKASRRPDHALPARDPRRPPCGRLHGQSGCRLSLRHRTEIRPNPSATRCRRGTSSPGRQRRPRCWPPNGTDGSPDKVSWSSSPSRMWRSPRSAISASLAK